MINVTKSFLPPKEEYLELVNNIWDSYQLTNNGPMVLKLQDTLQNFLGLQYLRFVTNGTIALQIALNVLDINEGEVITTPFSYVATVSSILWEKVKPVFVDIETNNFCIDAEKIEEKITPKTKAILVVHVFGYACNVEKIQQIADKHNLKVIYDGAHAFGVNYKGKSLLSYGDISTLSFHATKLFHTVEGGACISNNTKYDQKIELIQKFGHIGDEHFILGINGKNSEFHAAMGLCNIKYINFIISERRKISNLYDALLANKLQRPKMQQDLEYNYSYYPIIFETEQDLLNTFERLKKENIFPRRYFYPSLNTLPYLQNYQECPISEDISKRIACLPLYLGLEEESIKKIINLL